MSSNNEGELVGSLLVILIIAAVVVLTIASAVFIIPALIVGGLCWWAYTSWRDDPERKEKQVQQHTLSLYEQTLALYEAFDVDWTLPSHLISIADELLDAEVGKGSVEPPPVICNSIEGARYRDRLAKLGGVTEERVVRSQAIIEAALLSVKIPDLPGRTTVPLVSLLPKLGDTVETLIQHFFADTDYFKDLQRTIDKSYLETANTPIMPSDYKKDDLVWTYLKGTPLTKLFDLEVNFGIPEAMRSEHMHVVAGAGHGKSQLAQHLILKDLPKVKAGAASVVVIDSQRDMIERIAHLEEVKDLGDRLIYINAEDVEYPVALNLFDVKLDRIKEYSLRDQEQLVNGTTEMLEYVLSTLSADMTQKQELVVRMCIRLLIHVEDATLFTLADLLRDHRPFAEKIATLDPITRQFFETEFKDEKQYGETKRQIQRRLWGIIQNNSFANMFRDPRNKVDLFDAMNRGSLILVNTAKDVLKDDACSVLGKFIIALVSQAGQERAIIDQGDRLPTFLYIDEASDYFSSKIDTILSQLRKYNIGGIFLHQYLGQLENKLQQSMFANTSIRFAGGVSAQDAHTLSKQLRTSAEFVLEQPKGTFAVFLRNVTGTAVPLKIPFFEMEEAPRMDDGDYDAMITAMRAKYAVSPSDEPPEAPEGIEPDDPDEPDGGSDYSEAEDAGLRRFTGDDTGSTNTL